MVFPIQPYIKAILDGMGESIHGKLWTDAIAGCASNTGISRHVRQLVSSWQGFLKEVMGRVREICALYRLRTGTWSKVPLFLQGSC